MSNRALLSFTLCVGFGRGEGVSQTLGVYEGSKIKNLETAEVLSRESICVDYRVDRCGNRNLVRNQDR